MWKWAVSSQIEHLWSWGVIDNKFHYEILFNQNIWNWWSLKPSGWIYWFKMDGQFLIRKTVLCLFKRPPNFWILDYSLTIICEIVPAIGKIWKHLTVACGCYNLECWGLDNIIYCKQWLLHGCTCLYALLFR